MNRLIMSLAILCTPAIGAAHDGNNSPDVIHACINNLTKVVRVVGVAGRCLTAPPLAVESSAHWAVIGPQGPAGPIGPSGASGFHVYDSNNVVVGPVIATEGLVLPVTVFERDGHIVSIRVLADRLVGLEDRVYYDGPDCTGKAYVPRQEALAAPQPRIGTPFRTVYIPDPTAAPGLTVTVSAYRDGIDPCHPSPFGTTPINLVPALSIIETETHFTPPFRLGR